jgi:type II secretory pathway component PulK
MPMSLAPDRGIALVTVLLVSSLVFTMAVGLSLVLAVDHPVASSASLRFSRRTRWMNQKIPARPTSASARPL